MGLGIEPKVLDQRYWTKGIGPKVLDQRYALDGSWYWPEGMDGSRSILGLRYALDLARYMYIDLA